MMILFENITSKMLQNQTHFVVASYIKWKIPYLISYVELQSRHRQTKIAYKIIPGPTYKVHIIIHFIFICECHP